MKILVNSINHSPDLTGIGKYTGEMVKWLTDNGHEVRVVTAPPYYPQWQVLSGYSAFWYCHEKLDGANVIRCPLWIPGKLSGMKRIVHLASFAIAAFPVMIWTALTWRPDVVFVVEPPFACVPGALLAGWMASSKSWLHIQDFEIDAAFDLGMLKSKRLRRWISAVESWMMKRFDCVSTISLRMLDRLDIKGVSQDKKLLFENWVDTDCIYPLSERPALYEEFGLPQAKMVILYSGNMGEKQGLELIIDAARELSARDDLIFLMCGAGAARVRLEMLAAGLENMLFMPLQPLSKLNDLLNLAHIHLLPQKSGAEDLVMPSKLSNMMASGKPVVATVMPDSQIGKVLDGCGIVVDPGDLAGFCAAITDLADNPEKAIIMGKTGREYAESHWNINRILANVFGNEIGKN